MLQRQRKGQDKNVKRRKTVDVDDVAASVDVDDDAASVDVDDDAASVASSCSVDVDDAASVASSCSIDHPATHTITIDGVCCTVCKA